MKADDRGGWRHGARICRHADRRHLAPACRTLTTSLLQKYGASWTHSLAINDLYFDFMGPSLAAAGMAGNGAPKAGVAAGDGSEAAYPAHPRRPVSRPSRSPSR